MGSILLQLNGVSLIPESAMAVVRKVIASMNLVLRGSRLNDRGGRTRHANTVKRRAGLQHSVDVFEKQQIHPTIFMQFHSGQRNQLLL